MPLFCISDYKELLSFYIWSQVYANPERPLLTLFNHVMQGIKMKLNNPRFVIPGDSSDVDLEFPHCSRKHAQSESNAISCKVSKEKFKGLLFEFPQVRWFKAIFVGYLNSQACIFLSRILSFLFSGC
jgi:hypothetical protein